MKAYALTAADQPVGLIDLIRSRAWRPSSAARAAKLVLLIG